MVHDSEGHLVNERRAPGMLSAPAEQPAPLAHTYELPAVLTFRQVVVARRAEGHPTFRLRFRAWASRFSGRADRRLLEALASATQALADQNDILVDRLAAQEAATADINRVYGEELALLRAEVAHLSRMASAAPEEAQ